MHIAQTVNTEPPYLRVVLHDTAYLLHYVDAPLSVQGIYQLGQVGVAVPYGPVLQSRVSPLVIGRVAVGEGRYLTLCSISQQLIDVNPQGSDVSSNQLQDVHPYVERRVENRDEAHR